MKIKCPFENFDSALDYEQDELIWHLTEDHETREIVAEYYVKLLFKINEKIESIEKLEKQSEDFRNPPPPICNSKVKQELKSLLENKK